MSNPPGIMRDPVRRHMSDIPHILPHEKVFPIQIGSELFRLSGASISSDAPSYFSAYFQCQLANSKEAANGDESVPMKTLYIDRDPVTFADISRHLQGYHIQPRDGSHFVKLFADAQFYQLPRLVSQLFEDNLYISIGGREFRVQKDLFTSPGDSPNYFTLGFAFMFSSAETVFPGLDRDGLLRPPSIIPPSVPSRSSEIFAELVHLLKGYPIHIRNEEHRAELLRDCRYFLFKGLEQKLIPHQISYNQLRARDEITLRLEDIRQPGLSVLSDPSILPTFSSHSPDAQPRSSPTVMGWVNYARPFVDDRPYELVVEIGSEQTRLNTSTMRAEFFGDGKKRITRLFEVVANKMNLPATTQPLGLLMATGGASSQPASPGNTPLSEDAVKVVFDNAAITLDGEKWMDHVSGSYAGSGTKDAWEDEPHTPDEIESRRSSMTSTGMGLPPRKRRKMDGMGGAEGLWTVKSGQWRLRVQAASSGKSRVEVVLVAVKIEAFTSEGARNENKRFLSG